MKIRKPISEKLKAKNLTRHKKRLGRPPNYLTATQIANPTGEIAMPRNRTDLTTIDIIHGVLSTTRSKFGASMVGKADMAAVDRVNKRLQRIRSRMAKIEGIDRLR